MVLITGLWCTALSSTQNGPDHLGLRCDAQASWSFWPQSISSRSQPSGRLLKSPPSGISRTQARFTIPLPPPKAEAEAEEVEAEAEEAEEEAAERHHGCCPRLRRRWTQAMQWRRCSARRLVWPEAPTTATGIVVVVVVAVAVGDVRKNLAMVDVPPMDLEQPFAVVAVVVVAGQRTDQRMQLMPLKTV